MAESNCCREGQLSRLSLYLVLLLPFMAGTGILHQDADLSGFLFSFDNRQRALSNTVKSPVLKKDWLVYTRLQAT